MSSRPLAYPVPLWLDREGAPRTYRLSNIGDEPLRGLSARLLGPGHLEPVHVPVLSPGATVTLTVVGPELERSSTAVVRWFRPSGEEFLWRFSF